GDRLYLANYNGEVICYNHVRDTVEWRYATGGNVIIATLLDGDRLYVINAGGTIYNLTTGGSLRWKTELGSSIKADPVIRGGNMYAVTERVLYMIDTESGNVKWSYVMEHFPATGVTISDNNLYVGTEKNGIIVLRKD
ncbi:MAG TPA: PQQ-binding-like beta-propeller repeat protein, partial [Spirochaetota bacterium]|nr:PQQ-binding-like beta-propeller repeat protein [Spirochaetota bacterium]